MNYGAPPFLLRKRPVVTVSQRERRLQPSLAAHAFDFCMRGHDQERKVRIILALLKKRTAATIFMKVKAHIGIKGDEFADTGANLGRRMTEDDIAAGCPTICLARGPRLPRPILYVR